MSFKGTAILIVLGALGASSYGQDRDHDRDHGSNSSHSRTETTRSYRNRETSSSRDRSSANRSSYRSSDRETRTSRDYSRSSNSHSAGSRPDYSRSSSSRSDYSRTDSRPDYSRSGYSHSDYSRSGSTRYDSSRYDSSRSNPNVHGSGYSSGRSTHNDGIVFHDFDRDRDPGHGIRRDEGDFRSRGGERISPPSYRTNEFHREGGIGTFGRGVGSGGGRVLVRNSFIYQRPSWGGTWRDGYVRSPRFGVSFDFGFYLSTPYEAPCYVSPWYYYSSLPPYIPASRVVVMPNYNCDWDAGVTYQYTPEPYHASALDDAIDGLSNAYRNGIVESLNELIPSSGSIGIFVDGKYQYSVGGDEFQEMFEDSVKDTQTESFEVENVKREGDQATVNCRHEVKIPNGGFETIYQSYHLQKEDGHFVITDFLTSHSAEY